MELESLYLESERGPDGSRSRACDELERSGLLVGDSSDGVRLRTISVGRSRRRKAPQIIETDAASPLGDDKAEGPGGGMQWS